ncbi:DUF7657 domain-containing protein [Sporofaciens musculi]|uniref:DUF7657 domain-containing protein n=1 Tax=Sporofaciens musculi TaxID=2681861 RepID=UPI0025A27D09|nr:hypothetical protein [Sporofaciens musculi]
MKEIFEKKIGICKLLFFAISALVLALISGAYLFRLESFGDVQRIDNLLFYFYRAIFAKKVYLLAILLFSIFVGYDRFGIKLFESFYSYRFVIGLAIFLFCLIFELNGSSIGMWMEYLGGDDTGNILGVPRGIRSDEWAVSTPMMLSQYYNASGKFPYFSDTVRGASTDMFMVYGQPVMDIAMIFKPFYWGYLFLSAGKGLAFFWYGRWIALFLVSFEMFMFITKNDKLLSFTGSSLFAFAPLVQWWFAINGLVEMLIFGQLSVLMLKKYMIDNRTGSRVLYASVICICAGGFILTLYPAWQIPMAYVILGLGIWVIADNYKNCKINRKDILWLIVILVIFIGIMFHVWINSKETIELVMNTDYPGQRQETGGGISIRFFNYVTNIWYALFGEGTVSNPCESAQFIDFFPLCYIIPMYVLVKKKDKLIAILSCIVIFFAVWCLFGFPTFLSKVTFMSYSSTSRAFAILGVVNVLLLIRGLSLFEWRCSKLMGGILAIVGGYVTVRIGNSINSEFFPENRYYVYTVIIWVLFFYLLIRFRNYKYKVIFCILCTVMMVYSGALVNPVRRGVDDIYKNEVIQSIGNVHGQDVEALWAIEVGLPINNMGIMVGAPTINSTNVYPHLNRWETLDKKNKNKKVYNRYAHISVELKEEGEAEFQLSATDAFKVSITGEDMKALNVKYFVSVKDSLDKYESNKVKFTRVDRAGNYFIYEVQ